MIHIIKAKPNHVEGISKVCSDGYWATYSETHSEMYIKGIIKEFYNHERILKEVLEISKEWGGYFVAIEGNEVIGAGGGGMIEDTSGEVFVLYLNPARRNEGIGTMILDAITKQQKEELNATEQWVSVAKENQKGIPFYEAKGFIFNHELVGHGIVVGERYTSLRYCRKI
ncbi:GNAT family N-acetyltransferase [Sporosarcina sp. FSL K6-6792]|uniref:GNAT family N-acetyltransferase n=1 Tax=Sporosarcina sp. FSL K6-6792 TaxID=2921559 RepID=UPI0030FCEB58